MSLPISGVLDCSLLVDENPFSATPDSNVVQAQPTAAPQVEPSKPVVTQIQAPPQQPPQEEVKQQEVAPPATTSPSSSTITSGTTDKTSRYGKAIGFLQQQLSLQRRSKVRVQSGSTGLRPEEGSHCSLSLVHIDSLANASARHGRCSGSRGSGTFASSNPCCNKSIQSMPPPTLVPQQPYVFNYHPQAQGVYAVPTMPVYGYPAAAQAMGRPQFPGHQHPAPPPGPSTSQQQQVASQQPSNAPTPSNSGQMGESPQAQPIYHPGPMVHSVSMPQQMQMAQQQPQPPQQMPPPMAPVPRPPQQYPGMAPNATIFVPGGPPQQYGQPMVQYAGANQFAPAYYQQPTGQVTTMHNAMPPPNSMQPVGVQTPQAAGVGGHPYQVFHQNPQQPTGAPIVTSSQPYTGGPQAYAGNAGMPQMVSSSVKTYHVAFCILVCFNAKIFCSELRGTEHSGSGGGALHGASAAGLRTAAAVPLLSFDFLSKLSYSPFDLIPVPMCLS